MGGSVILAALLLSQAAPWQAPGVVYPKDVGSFIQPEDCLAKYCDIGPGLRRALAEAESEVAAVPGITKSMGGDIVLPGGVFYYTGPTILSRAHRIRGAGGIFPAPQTPLIAKTSTHGFVVPATGAGATLEGFALVNLIPSKEFTAGILLNGRAAVSSLWVRGYVHGVHIFGWVKDPVVYSNVNGARVWNVRLDLQEHSGIYLDGPDANANVIEAADIGSGCTAGRKWSTALGYECAGLHDSSFLGNTIIGAQVAFMVDRTTKEPFRTYWVDSKAARTVLIGCYGEDDSKPAWLEQGSVWWGGLGRSEGPGLRNDGVHISGMRIAGVPLSSGELPPEVFLGNQVTLPGTVMMLVPPQAQSVVPPNAVYRWRMGATSWYTDIAGLGAGISSRTQHVAPSIATMQTKTSSKTVLKP